MGSQDRIQALIEEAKAGSREAFDELAQVYRERLRALVYSRLGPVLRERLEVEDVVQETFLKAFRSVERFHWQGEDSFLRWLGGIAENLLLYLAREHRKSRKLPLDGDVPAGGTSPSQMMRRDERFERLQAALDGLSPEHREVIILARLQGLPIRDIAKRLDRSPNATAQLLWRALQRLRASFGGTESFHLPDRSLEERGPEHGE